MYESGRSTDVASGHLFRVTAAVILTYHFPHDFAGHGEMHSFFVILSVKKCKILGKTSYESNQFYDLGSGREQKVRVTKREMKGEQKSHDTDNSSICPDAHFE